MIYNITATSKNCDYWGGDLLKKNPPKQLCSRSLQKLTLETTSIKVKQTSPYRKLHHLKDYNFSLCELTALILIGLLFASDYVERLKHKPVNEPLL